MERHLRAQFDRLLADDCADGDAEQPLRARLAADVADALEDAIPSPSAAAENDADDLTRAAAYLDGRLAGREREAFLTSLAANARRREDLASAAALLGAIEAEPMTAPADLFARAGSVFAPRGAQAERGWPRFVWRNRAVGWSLAALALLVFVPSALVLVGRMDWPFRAGALSNSWDALTPPRLDAGVGRLPSAPPASALTPEADAAGQAREAVDIGRSGAEPSSCEAGPTAETDRRMAVVAAKKDTSSSLRRAPCPPPTAATNAAKALDERRSNPEHGATASHSNVPPTSPSAILPSAR
jgi:hypothetical protein